MGKFVRLVVDAGIVCRLVPRSNRECLRDAVRLLFPSHPPHKPSRQIFDPLLTYPAFLLVLWFVMQDDALLSIPLDPAHVPRLWMDVSLGVHFCVCYTGELNIPSHHLHLSPFVSKTA